MVENRFIGIKSRGVYETPGGTTLLFSRTSDESVESFKVRREPDRLKLEVSLEVKAISSKLSRTMFPKELPFSSNTVKGAVVPILARIASSTLWVTSM